MTVYYVPAGIEQYTTNISLYSRVKKSPIEESIFLKGCKQWRTHNYEVAKVTGAASRYLPLHRYDASVSIFSPSFVKLCGYKIVLANPLSSPYDSEHFRKAGLYSIVDSGGYQMLQSRTCFVSPDDVIERYNRDADIGMPLDIPMRQQYESTYFDRVSAVMRENDKYIEERLDDRVKLALISHGTDLSLRKRRLDAIDRPADVVAIAGLNIKQNKNLNELFVKVEQLMYVTSRYKDTAKYFHVLGVTGKLFLFIYCLLESLKFVKNIGADSVSHRMYALVGMMMHTDFTISNLDKTQKFQSFLPCNCPVCSVIKDYRIIQETTVLESHNLWVCMERIRLLQNLTDALVDGSVTLEYIYKYLNIPRVTIVEFYKIYDYIRNVVAGGFKPLVKTTGSKSLFGVKKKHKPAVSEHYEEILKRYSEFYGKTF